MLVIYSVTFVRLFGFFSQTVDMRDELTLQDGLIFKANTVVIPRSLHADMKARVHSSHKAFDDLSAVCLLYTSPSPRDRQKSRMPSSA